VIGRTFAAIIDVNVSLDARPALRWTFADSGDDR
jgi:hypothetical protein